MKSILIVNNIPTPYRNFFYAELARSLRERDIILTVAFQGQKGRSHISKYEVGWDFGNLDFNFRNYFSSIFGYRFKYHSRISLNLDIFIDIVSSKYDLILAPPTMSLWNWLYCILPLRGEKILYNEYHNNGGLEPWLSRKLKRQLYKSFNYIATPGEKAKNYLVSICPVLLSARNIHLPNIIDEGVFLNDKVQNNRGELLVKYNLPSNKRILVGTGIAEYKGRRKLIDEFHKCGIIDGILVLIGGGENLSILQKQVGDLNLGNSVFLLGNRSQLEVREILMASDIFIHSASSDPSPLAAVEAGVLGLPLVLTKQTGNHPELLINKENGYLFDYNDSFSAILNLVFKVSSDELAKFGQKSKELAFKNFGSKTVVKALTSDLSNILERFENRN